MADSATECKQFQVFWQNVPLPERMQISLPQSRKKVIIISGPTAVGKTSLSLLVAGALGGEIISADSMQVYKGMDIGTAKASWIERETIPHHLIDIREPGEPFNVMDFWQEATRLIDEIHARGSIPVIVGGTGFYIHSLLYGPPTGPASVESVRTRWETEIDIQGASILYEQLKEIDPKYAATITSNDKHKIVRAFEIITLTNKKVSDFVGNTSENCRKYNFRCWFLYMPKEILYQRIEERCDEMIRLGFIEEVKALLLRGLENSAAAQAIGYRQCLEFLRSPQTQEDREQFIFSFKQASRRYAKRQFTWFRKEPRFRWLNRDEVSFERAAEVILQDAELSL